MFLLKIGQVANDCVCVVGSRGSGGVCVLASLASLHNPVLCSILPEFPAQQRAQRSNVHNTWRCTTQGVAQHREMHNTASCTTQGVAQHRELHNTGRCTTQGDAQRPLVLISSRGSRAGRAPLPACLNFLLSNVHNATTCTTQGVAHHREMHNTGRCTT